MTEPTVEYGAYAHAQRDAWSAETDLRVVHVIVSMALESDNATTRQVALEHLQKLSAKYAPKDGQK